MSNLQAVLLPAVIETTASTGTCKGKEGLEIVLASLETKYKNLLAVLWLENTVATGYMENGLHFALPADVEVDHMIEARIFNKDMEMHIWRISSGEYGWRLRLDGEGIAVETVTLNQYLWGTTATTLANHWSMLSEDRGFTLAVPFEMPAGAVDIQHRLAVKVRLYIGFNNDHQAGYVDDRFVAFSAFAGTDREIALRSAEA